MKHIPACAFALIFSISVFAAENDGFNHDPENGILTIESVRILSAPGEFLVYKVVLQDIGGIVPTFDIIEFQLVGDDNNEEPPFDSPSIKFTFVPAIGSTENLLGVVEGVVDPSAFAVAVYIKVGSGWWTKPRWSTPLSVLNDDGVFECDITTGGFDTQASEVAAFVVPHDFSPPLLSGHREIPASLEEDSVASVYVIR